MAAAPLPSTSPSVTFGHIRGKVPMEVKEDASMEAKNLSIYVEASSPEDFAVFCKAAVTDKASQEYPKLYYHLLRCFTSADAGHSGRVTSAEFDG